MLIEFVACCILLVKSTESCIPLVMSCDATHMTLTLQYRILSDITLQSCMYLNRTLVVMGVLAQLPRMMCVECVEGMGVHAH